MVAQNCSARYHHYCPRDTSTAATGFSTTATTSVVTTVSNCTTTYTTTLPITYVSTSFSNVITTLVIIRGGGTKERRQSATDWDRNGFRLNQNWSYSLQSNNLLHVNPTTKSPDTTTNTNQLLTKSTPPIDPATKSVT